MNKLPLFAALIGLLAAPAAAQTSVSASAARPVTNAVVPVLPFGQALGGAGLVSPLATLGLAPTLSAPSLTPTLSAPAAVAPGAKAVSVAAAAIPAAAPSALRAEGFSAIAAPVAAQASALSVLSVSAASVSDEKAAPAKLDETFDGAVARASADGAVSAPAPKSRGGFLGRAASAAGMFIAAPVAQLSIHSPSAEPVTALQLLVNYGPLATAIAAILGALFGLWSARGKDGSPANAGQALSSSLSFGVIAGAAAFTLLDLTKVAFLGTAVAALTPLTAAVATAALAQAAFSAKFTDPATTPADRIIGAFPAVAMSFGLGIGVMALASPVGLFALATWAMMATGAATALYTALFRLDKSAATGPGAMGRGVVLQSLMSGLAFAIGPSPYALFFLALSAWGFVSVLRTTAQEAWSASEGLRARFKRK